MNKRIIALAVAAVASSAALADDGVTLYGRMDVGVIFDQQMNTLINGGNAVNSTRIDNLSTNSRIGFKGQEDLGGGMKSYFKLETGVAPDNNANSGSFGSREAWVGLIGPAGTVSLGRGKHPFQLATEDFDLFDGFDGATLDITAVDGVAGANRNRSNNAVKFDSANFGGFSFSALYGAGENKTLTKDSTDIFSTSGKFEAGDLWIEAAFDQTRNAGSTQNKTKEGGLIGAGYTLGDLSFAAAYQTAKDDTTSLNVKRDKFLVNAAYAIDKLTLKAGYIYGGKIRTSAGDITDSKYDHYVLGVNYALSKRTALIAEYTQISFKNKAVAQAEAGLGSLGDAAVAIKAAQVAGASGGNYRKDPSALVLGLMHSF